MKITEAVTKRYEEEKHKPIHHIDTVVKGAQSVFLNDIKYARDTNGLYALVEMYLKFIYEETRDETWGETAARLGGDVVLEAAEAKWFELGC